MCNSDIYAVYRFPEMIFLVANDVLARHIFNEVERRSEYWFENIKHFFGYGAAPAEARYQISGVASALGVQFRSC